jgi:hypothetical protein
MAAEDWFDEYDFDLDHDGEPFIARRERARLRLAEFSAFLARLKAGKAKPRASAQAHFVTGDCNEEGP